MNDRRPRNNYQKDRYQQDNESEEDKYNKLFVANLLYKTTKESLKEYFGKYGTVVESWIVLGKEGRSKGYGFIKYSSMDDVDNCQANRPHILEGRELNTKRAVPKDAGGDAKAAAECFEIYIGGITEDITELDLKDYFAKFGLIKTVRVKHRSGKQHGFGFIKFEDRDVVDKLVLLKMHVINDHKCFVRKCLSREEEAACNEKNLMKDQARLYEGEGGYDDGVGYDSYGSGQGGYGAHRGFEGPSYRGRGYGGRQGGYGGSDDMAEPMMEELMMYRRMAQMRGGGMAGGMGGHEDDSRNWKMMQRRKQMEATLLQEEAEMEEMELELQHRKKIQMLRDRKAAMSAEFGGHSHGGEGNFGSSMKRGRDGSTSIADPKRQNRPGPSWGQQQDFGNSGNYGRGGYNQGRGQGRGAGTRGRGGYNNF